MSDLLKDGMTKLRSLNKENRARTITYARSGISAVTLTATIGRSMFDARDKNGFVFRDRMIDFIVSVADMTAFGEPQLGDIITDTANSSTRTFKVMSPKPPTNESFFQELDGFGIGYRIHTKEVG